MRHIVFCEDAKASSIQVAVYEAAAFQWQDSVQKQVLGQWLKQALADGRIQKQDVCYWLVPEQALMRRHAQFSQQSTRHQQEKMAKQLLRLTFGEACSGIRLRPIGDTTEYAICGVRQSYADDYAAVLGSYQRWFQWASLSEWQLLSHLSRPEDGYYAIEDGQRTSVVAVYQGQVVESRTAAGQQEQRLLEELVEENKSAAFQLTPVLKWCSSEYELGEAVEGLEQIAIAKPQITGSLQLKGDRTLLTLCLLCLLLPGVLLLAGPRSEAPTTSEGTTTETANPVVHSAYSTLLGEAYAAKSERIVLLNHQAADGALAISGRCAETLDVADYMRQLEKATPSLHPLLLDLALKTEDKNTYYEFVVQISLQEGETVE